MRQHRLQPLLQPASVALVDAGDRSGSVARVVLQNLLRAGYQGELHRVGRSDDTRPDVKVHRSLRAIGAPVDLAIIVAAPRNAERYIDDAGAAGVRAAMLLTDPQTSLADEQQRWLERIAARAKAGNMRLVGPNAFGIVRTDIGLNASLSDVAIARGGLALVAQSGAMCAAMLDFASPMGIGFSTVVSIGGGIDVDFGELLDALLLDPATDGILLYVEVVHDSRRFMSALRAAARTKPVIVLKAGRSQEAARANRDAPTHDAVFDAAIRRAGTVRVHTYTQLFAAARILSTGRLPRGERLAIVANGRGPGVLAADRAIERGLQLARLAPPTLAHLAPQSAMATPGNPVDVLADATPEKFATTVAGLLADAGVDAVLALYVRRPPISATEVARAVATASRRSDKPVLGAWLGAIERHEARIALEAGGVANFFTPENAVEAFSFLTAYRRHQAWLLEVPSPQPEPTRPDLETAAGVLRALAANTAVALAPDAAIAVLQAFGIPSLRSTDVHTAHEAQRACGLAHPAVLAEYVLCVHADPVFGPVIALGRGRLPDTEGEVGVLMLPPLNRRLALDLVEAADARRFAPPVAEGEPREALVRRLLQLSTLVCALPWVTELSIGALLVTADDVVASSVRVVGDARRAAIGDYRHMAIHPYPAELESSFTTRSGVEMQVRPIRPDDALREQQFVAALSDQARFHRFFHMLQQLTPAMLARFTQIDYDREMALVALVDDATGVEGYSFAGVARFVQNPDGDSAEYALVVADRWQRQGVGRALMDRLMTAARGKGIARLEGVVLRDNAAMLRFVAALGFTVTEDSGDPENVITLLELGSVRPDTRAKR